ncbi:hypothetical protein M9H77_01507 [Catharanthus roseus]|uniref:Uncharacterized protein n=1 Tax=Catharanthus roseus TaxID=4058 RepID=A0ACC0C5V3_CATRO|nr:hypothetical protein M9H77_01507 [Catharanthus roseus]
MKSNSFKPFISKCFFFSLLFTVPLLLLLSRNNSVILIVVPVNKTPPQSSSTGGEKIDDLKIRPGYNTYESYIQKQLNKTLNPGLRKIWKTRDWDRKIKVFIKFFNDLKQRNLLFNESKALSIGARMGQEVEAMKQIGVSDSIGMDLVPSLPLVVAGDFHKQPFMNETFDFEFSNVFDHALYPHKFVGEIERTLKPDGVCVLHVALSHRADKYSANDLYSVEPLKKLFKRSELIHVQTVDGFGLDTEVVFRKKK